MKTPFTIEQFFEVFKTYNEGVFPIQLLIYILALAAIFIAIKHYHYAGKIISFILSLLWFWMGIVYHFNYFTSINNAAWIFGGLFVLQGIIFFVTGVLQNKLTFRFNSGIWGITGALLIIFSLVIYPVISYINGHAYPSTPTFGLPCPTTIFTLGLICWVDKKLSPVVWIIPVLWSVIGFWAAFSLGMTEDISLFVAGILTVILLTIKYKFTTVR